jgi:hypothetical protein
MEFSSKSSNYKLYKKLFPMATELIGMDSCPFSDRT